MLPVLLLGAGCLLVEPLGGSRCIDPKNSDQVSHDVLGLFMCRRTSESLGKFFPHEGHWLSNKPEAIRWTWRSYATDDDREHTICHESTTLKRGLNTFFSATMSLPQLFEQLTSLEAQFPVSPFFVAVWFYVKKETVAPDRSLTHFHH